MCEPHILALGTIAGDPSRFVKVDGRALAALREMSGGLCGSELCFLLGFRQLRRCDLRLHVHSLFLADALQLLLIFEKVRRGDLPLGFAGDDIDLTP